MRQFPMQPHEWKSLKEQYPEEGKTVILKLPEEPEPLYAVRSSDGEFILQFTVPHYSWYPNKSKEHLVFWAYAETPPLPQGATLSLHLLLDRLPENKKLEYAQCGGHI